MMVRIDPPDIASRKRHPYDVPMAGGGSDGRSVAEKLFAIADAFQGREELSLSEIAGRARLPLSTAHRLVAEWVDVGRPRARRRRALPTRHEALAARRARSPPRGGCARAARPYLEDLLESTREHVHLAVRDGLGAIYLERLSGPDAVPVISDVGSRLPLHATGVGLVLLAYAPPGRARRGARGEPAQVPAEHADDRAGAARRGSPRSARSASRPRSRSSRAGAFSVAAPVRDATGEVVAAVSIIAHVERRDEPQFALGVRMAARGVSTALGWRP